MTQTYEKFRRENKELTIHQVTAKYIFNLEDFSVVSDLDETTREHITRFIAERRLQGAPWVHFDMDTFQRKYGSDNSYVEREFFTEEDFINFLTQEFTARGKRLERGSDGGCGRTLVDKVMEAMNNGEESSLSRSIDYIRNTPILSRGIFLEKPDFTSPRLLGIYGGLKSSESANDKQLIKWVDDLVTLEKMLKKPYSGKLSEVSERQKKRLDEVKDSLRAEDLYRVEDVFRIELVFGGTIDNLVERVDNFRGYIANNHLFDIVEEEDYLDGQKVEDDGTVRKRTKEYQFKIKLSDSILSSKSIHLTEKLIPRLMRRYLPDTFEIHFVTGEELIVSEFDSEVGRLRYANSKRSRIKRNLENDTRYDQINQMLVKTSPVPENEITQKTGFWQRLDSAETLSSYEDYTTAIRRRLAEGSSTIKSIIVPLSYLS